MSIKNINKLEGWNTVEDVENKLGVKKSTAYLYLHRLYKSGHVIQKIRKAGGAIYLISKTPSKYRHQGMYEGTDLIAPVQEFSMEKIPYEQKIAFFLKKYKDEKNTRYNIEAKKIIRKIKNWKLLYRYLKLYNSKEAFKHLYIESRKSIKKIPKMPKRYKNLLD